MPTAKGSRAESAAFKVVIGRAAADPQFRKRFLKDASGTVKAAGIKISAADTKKAMTLLAAASKSSAGVERLQARVSRWWTLWRGGW